MKATMEIAARFTAPMSGMETGMAGQKRITEGSYGENSGHRWRCPRPGVISAENGRTGLMLCHRGDPDAVVLDLHMLGIDGRSVLQQLRTLHPSLPVVVFSGHRAEDVEEEMLHQGATAFIQKAFSLHQLGLALQEVLPSPSES
jgi:two-component system OmpR family response regulator